MSDDQPTRDESAVPFFERVTIDTLADRPSIPSFDTSPKEWQPETSLRLEGRFNRNPGGSPLQNYTDETVVVIIGPEDVFKRRDVVIFDHNNQKMDTKLLFGEGRLTVGSLRDQEARSGNQRTITEDKPIIFPINKTRQGHTALNATEVFVPETIKAGPLPKPTPTAT